MMTGGKFESSAAAGRRDSRKRRRLSERRRVFGRIGMAEQRLLAGSLSSEGTWSRQSSAGQFPLLTGSAGTQNEMADQQQLLFPIRSDSPLADNSKISMKIQFHITVAPDNEPLLFDASQLSFNHHSSSSSFNCSIAGLSTSADALGADQPQPNQRQSTETTSSIGDQIHEKLSRQSTLSTRRRQQLLALHNQSAMDSNNNNNNNNGGPSSTTGKIAQPEEGGQPLSNSMPEQLGAASRPAKLVLEGREPGERSSTITGGMADEATVRFLARHRQVSSGAGARNSQGSLLGATNANANSEREHIYFKRDGQRFGHEFTLKLSIDKTYRCLIKVRPLIPLQAISVQGHQVLFVDCSQTASGSSSSTSTTVAGSSQSAPSSALASAANLTRSWNNIHNNHYQQQQQQQPYESNYTTTTATTTTNQRTSAGSSTSYKQQQNRLNHAQTTINLNKRQSDSQFLYQQQQSQMMRHFAASHCSSSSSAHLGSQLIYMFDWSASRFEVNKNKARTQIQTVLKFKNGQILSLPLQVKFYQPDSKQHLSWGSQLHFIDYDCNINNMGQINVDRIHYY